MEPVLFPDTVVIPADANRLLFCVRHGQSLYNLEGRVQGQSDVPLSDLGRRQSHAVAEALSRLPVEAIYSSPLARARETAEILAASLLLEIRFDPRLMELHAGIFQDQLRRDLPVLFPTEYAAWLSGDPDYRIPGGQSRREVALRGSAALRDIARQGTGHTVVVSHGALLRLAFAELLGGSIGNPLEPLENGSISLLADCRNSTFRLLLYNWIGHLDDIGLAGTGDL